MYFDAAAAGYLNEGEETNSPIIGSILNMPTISKEELMGLVRTFSLYVKFSRQEWPQIKIAEQFTKEGNAKFKELSAHYYERFFDHDFKWTKKSCISTSIYQTPYPGKQQTEIISG